MSRFYSCGGRERVQRKVTVKGGPVHNRFYGS